jgi:RimJ/RimL family protein N-acetyltransferase
MPPSLVVVPFSAERLDLVKDFSCGEEPHERELAEWIRQDALPAMSRGTNVWLYATEDRELVGFGSLGVTNWRWPDPSSRKVAVQVIPAVAIQKVYWGKPEGPREGRYSSQILDHLIAEATDLSDVSPLLGLFVHPDNQRAIKLYERAGFVPFSHTYTDKKTGVVYRSMIYELRKRDS